MAEILSDENYNGRPQHPPFADVLLARTIRRLKQAFGVLRPFYVSAFHGYGCDDSIILQGRVVERLEIGSSKKDDPWWRNLRNMIRVFLRARAEKALLTATIQGQSVAITTDEIGYFRKEVPLREKLDRPGWVDVHFDLQRIPGYREISRQGGKILSIPTSTRRSPGIISDIDDTIVETFATDLLMTARLTFINNSTTRTAVDGMAELYNAIIRSTSALSPVFYITSSSWSLYHLWTEFLDLQKFPQGPLLMQKIGLANNKLIRKGHHHKIEKIETVLRMTKDLPFFLIGDNGQADRQIYFDIASRHPHRVAAVCIRVAREKAKPFTADYASIGVPYFEFENGFSLREKLVAKGLIAG
ncbi:MAG: phosphatase domain-containing protein [Syntrophotaleaceae bacterium]